MKNICELAEEFLKQYCPKEIDNNKLESYFVGDNCNYSTLEDVFERLIISAQNYQNMSNVIGYAVGKNKKAIDDIICNLDYKSVLKKYNTDSLFDEFKNKFEFSVNKNKKQNSWYKFSNSIISAAKFVSQFKDVSEFKKIC